MDHIHERIRRLLALANDPANPNEAAAAAAAAQKLMFKHSISAEQLEIQEEELVTCEAYRVQGKQVQYWRHILITGVARSNDCRAYRSGNTLQLFGTEAQVQTVRYIYAYLDRTIEALCKTSLSVALAAVDSKTARSSFKLGAAEQVCLRLWQAYKAQRREVEGQGTALAIINNKLARLEKEYENIGTQSYRRKVSTDDEMCAAGHRAGAKIPLENRGSLGQASSASFMLKAGE